jgi:hypothetical protein
MIDLNKFGLTESIVVVPIVCSNCLDELDIGDDCYVDHSEGLEEKDAKVYCTICVEEF